MALSQGHKYDEAVQIATNSLHATLQQQSLLLALKEILGYLLVISVIIAVVSRFIKRFVLHSLGQGMIWFNMSRRFEVLVDKKSF